MTIEMTEVLPLKPFVGSYQCALADADTIDEQLVKQGGVIVKTRVPKKKFVGLISRQREMRDTEFMAAQAGTLPASVEIVGDVSKAKSAEMLRVVEHPAQRTVMVPADMAAGLVERGLAEYVKAPKRKAA